MSETSEQAASIQSLGNDASTMLYEAAKQTWLNRHGRYGEVRSGLDSFSGVRTYGIGPLLAAPGPEALAFIDDGDGIGTKVTVSQRTSRYETAAFDLLAMACDDPAARGFEPAVETTLLDVNSLEDESASASMHQLASGLVEAARRARVAVIGGETAILGALVGGYGDPRQVLQFNWGAVVHGVGHEQRLLDGSAVRAGDALVAFGEPGLRSNGLTLVRGALEGRYGPDWHKQKLRGEILGDLVLQPSIIYTPVLVDCIGGYDLRTEAQAPINGAAHITGGGLPEKMGRLLEASGLGAELEAPLDPSFLMLEVQTASGLSDEAIYKQLNMGQGMVVATRKPHDVMAVAESHGVAASEVGRIIKESELRIRSKGARRPGQTLRYEL